jgi:hypothetical protein
MYHNGSLTIKYKQMKINYFSTAWFRAIFSAAALSGLVVFASSCDPDDDEVEIYNPDTAQKVSVDRFSATAGNLQVRTAANGLPAPNQAVNFDADPFITKGLGPQGQHVEYYNFDIQPTLPAPIWVLFRENDPDHPVTGQLNIIDVLPGETGYNDFWQVIKVTVPADYKANEVASYAEIVKRNYHTEPTNMLVNCPVVPEGSTATKRLINEPAGLIRGWYKEKVVFYFSFSEKNIVTVGGRVPTSPIYVSFVTNYDANNPASGPASGFVTELGSPQTHNVVATLPADNNYSPLWRVDAYNNTAFGSVTNLSTAQAAPAAGTALGLVNCPIVKIQN